MSNHLEKVKEIINKNKKKLIMRTSIAVVGLGVAGVTAVYSIAKSNINYTIEEAKEVVLKAIEGDVLKVNKNLELDSFSFEYEFKIKDSNNILREVTVDSNLGVITDLDNYYD